jgi:hypothetical protein
MNARILISFLALSALAPAQEKEKFRLLFNGKDLTGWKGEGYVVEDGTIRATEKCRNLMTEATFSSYILDFDFKNFPMTNNGLGIHYPGHGDGAYTGMELQILENEGYKKTMDLKDDQYHGSLYTLAPAKKEGLKPPGEWNKQRVSVIGSKVTVVLNGIEILNADLDELAAKNPEHEGVKRRSGHIAFLGHGSEVAYRNINIVEIPPAANEEGVKAAGFKRIFNGRDLTGWKYESDGEDNWLAVNRILKHTGKKGKTDHLWTEESYKDFTMVFDWRWSGRGEMKHQPVILPDGTQQTGADGSKITAEIEEVDSGILLRGEGKSQVNLWNWTVGSGEIYGYRMDPKQSPEVKAACTPKRKADRPLGEWNRMMISVKGDTVNVSLNGETVIENATLEGMPAEGPIGLQHHGQAIDFANIWVKHE